MRLNGFQFDEQRLAEIWNTKMAQTDGLDAVNALSLAYEVGDNAGPLALQACAIDLVYPNQVDPQWTTQAHNAFDAMRADMKEQWLESRDTRSTIAPFVAAEEG